MKLTIIYAQWRDKEKYYLFTKKENQVETDLEIHTIHAFLYVGFEVKTYVVEI